MSTDLVYWKTNCVNEPNLHFREFIFLLPVHHCLKPIKQSNDTSLSIYRKPESKILRYQQIRTWQTIGVSPSSVLSLSPCSKNSLATSWATFSCISHGLVMAATSQAVIIMALQKHPKKWLDCTSYWLHIIQNKIKEN